MDFLGLLLTVLVLSAISNEPTETPENLTTFVPEYEYADTQYVNDVSFSPVPIALPSEDNPELPAETEYIGLSSDYEEYYVTEDLIQHEYIVTVTTETEILYEEEADSAVTIEEVELDANPTMQAEIDTTEANCTSVTHTEDTPICAGTTLLKLATVILAAVSAALFITAMLIIWNKGLIFSSIKDENMCNINSNDPELGKVKYQDTFTV